MVAPPLIATVLARVPADDAGAASGVLLTATQIANALGVAIVGGTFSATSALGTHEAFTISASGATARRLDRRRSGNPAPPAPPAACRRTSCSDSLNQRPQGDADDHPQL